MVLFFLPGRSQSTRIEKPASDYIFRNIDNASGLNSNDVYGLTQDRKGYMWIATEKGLERYDGIRFVDCFKNAGKQGSLSLSGLYLDDAHGRVLYSQPDDRLRQWNYVTNTSADTAMEQGPGKKYMDAKGVEWTISQYWADSSKGLLRIQQAGKPTDWHDFF
jgi:ligand-binding sensor domain-containing protein